MGITGITNVMKAWNLPNPKSPFCTAMVIEQ